MNDFKGLMFRVSEEKEKSHFRLLLEAEIERQSELVKAAQDILDHRIPSEQRALIDELARAKLRLQVLIATYECEVHREKNI